MIDFVTVGDSGNPDEDGFSLSDSSNSDLENSGVGYVAEEFEIGTTEVTNEMYVRFLNAVAADDKLYGLYTTLMATDPLGGIVRSGSNGNYTYRLKDPSAARKPVNFVSSFDAMRFINWLHNGMPGDPQAVDQTKRAPLSGPQGPDSTEDGAYSLVGKNPRDIVRRNLQARYFLPDVDEFHKAAYYDPNPGGNRPSQSYWPFADQSTGGPGGNFLPNDVLIDVGTGGFGPSHYGTYDQDGNVAEWTDSLITSSVRAIAGRGGNLKRKAKAYETLAQGGGGLDSRDALEETSLLGFRVAKPAPRTFQPPAFQPVLVLVDGAGNADDSRLRPGALDTVPSAKKSLGAVNYSYKIGAYETTNEEYCRFLNSVAARSDPYGLYDSRMAISKVRQSDGTFRYAPSDPEAPRQPVVYVSLFSAMRFCNWLHNGATAGGDTETGAYRLLGNLPSSSFVVTRSAGARFFIPGEDEWYKAAFYSKNLASYSSYATQKNTASPAEINYFSRGLNQARGLIETGDLGVSSWYGTYDQSGNAGEWTETLESDLTRYTRGGSYQDFADEDFETEFLPEFSVSWRGHSYAPPEMKLPYLGFRIAAAEDVQSGSFDPDTDRDGIPNGWEEFYGLNPYDPADAALDGDKDGKDGLTNLEEYLQRNGVYGLSTNPTQSDSDSDGLTDGAEVKTHGTNPLRADTDGDTLIDKAELDGIPSTEPLKRDTDGDGLADNVEIRVGTHPSEADEAPSDAYFARVGSPGNKEDVLYDGNLADGQQAGHVAEEYEIGKFEVTNYMYVVFLNAVARFSDPNMLFSERMRLDPRGGIERQWNGGSRFYTVKPGAGGKAVNFVSYWDSLRYVNWLHNGRPDTGKQDKTTTESGVYRLPVSPRTGETLERTMRSPDARYFLPDEDEWHKAAYYEASALGKPPVRNPLDSYWFYADQKDSGPTSNLDGEITKVAEAPSSSSNYGTYDQDGNVAEWIESSGYGTFVAKFARGQDLSVSLPYPDTSEGDATLAQTGFRVCRAVPASTVVLPPSVRPLMAKITRPRNGGDPSAGYSGGVDYVYKIGTFEVTNGEFAAFLNAVASDQDPHRLYDARMAAGQGGIVRSGSPGSYSYSSVYGRNRKPANYVDLASAMRYCNWLHNGGTEGADTENGAYRMSNAVKRNASARYFLPNEHEWRKAAYYDPTAVGTGYYWSFAMRTDQPSISQIAGLPESVGLQNVGVPGLPSYFRTFGQTGNVEEWVETFEEPSGLVLGGGLGSTWGPEWPQAIAAQRRVLPVSSRTQGIGFRIASRADSDSRGTRKQTIAFPRLPRVNLHKGSVILSAKASSGLPIEFASSDETVAVISPDGKSLELRSPGRALITAAQNGDQVWAPAAAVRRQLVVLDATE